MVFAETVAWLRCQLVDGPKGLQEIELAGAAAGIARNAIRRARRYLQIDRRCNPADGKHYLTLPTTPVVEGCYESHPDRLLRAIRDREAGGEPSKEMKIEDVVSWVSEHLTDRLGDMEPCMVPSGRALSMLIWAKGNQDDFLSMYESKLMPIRSVMGRNSRIKTSDAGNGGRSTIDRLLKKTGT